MPSRFFVKDSDNNRVKITDACASAYGDLTILNTARTVLDAVGHELLEEFTADYLDLLETSGAIYEANGDYALGIFSWGRCRFLDQASRGLCRTGSRIVGSANFGYGDPPRDPRKLKEIADRYRVDTKDLERLSRSYQSRPPELIEMAKNRLRAAARLIGTLVQQKQTHDALVRAEQEWKKIFQAIGHPTLFFDMEHRILDANHAAIEAAAMRFEELRGKRCYEIFHGARQAPLGCPTATLLEKGAAEETEVEFEALQRTHMVSCTPVVDDRDNLEKIIHIATDITTRKQADDAVKASEARYRTVVEAHDDAISRWLPDTTLTFTNERYRQIFGISQAQATRRKWLELVPGAKRKATAAFCDELARFPKKVAYEHPVTGRNGENRWYHWVDVPLFDASGALVEFHSVGRDITERKRDEWQLERNNRLLEAVSHIQTMVIQDATAREIFETMLNDILELTESEYGFMGEILQTSKRQPYLRTHALTNIAWNEETRVFYRENAPKGLEFSNLDTLFGEAIKTGGPIIANDPPKDPRSGGLPEGHPPLRAFLGIPLLVGDVQIGMVGIANRPGGYNEGVITFLQPMLATCIAVIEYFKNREKRRTVEKSLEKSERLFRDVFEHASSGKSLTRPDGKFIMVNQAFCDMLGYDAKALATKSFADITHPDDLAVSRKVRHGILAGEAQSKGLEKRYIRSDGKVIWADVRTTLLRDDAGKPTHIITDSYDITARKEADRALRHQKELLQKVMDNIPLMVAFMDADGRIQWVNRSWEHTIGYTLAQVKEGDIWTALYPDPQYRRQVADSIHRADGIWGDFSLRTRHGDVIDTVWINATLSDGTHIGIGEDTTERKHREKAQKDLESQLHQAQKMESVGRLAGGVAHDFNNLLSIIIGYTDLVLEKLPDAHPTKEDIKEIQAAGRRAKTLTRQLLAFARK